MYLFVCTLFIIGTLINFIFIIFYTLDGHYEVSVPSNKEHYISSLTVGENVTLVVLSYAKLVVSRDLNAHGNLWTYYRSTLTVNGLAEIWGELYWRGGEKNQNNILIS